MLKMAGKRRIGMSGGVSGASINVLCRVTKMETMTWAQMNKEVLVIVGEERKYLKGIRMQCV